MYEIRKETIDNQDYHFCKFAEKPSIYYQGYIEHWEVCDEACYDGYGYVMFCRVKDANGNLLFSDHGETYELYHNAKHGGGLGDYRALWKACKNGLRRLGIKDFNIKEDK